jgi:hypothetical protein
LYEGSIIDRYLAITLKPKTMKTKLLALTFLGLVIINGCKKAEDQPVVIPNP